MIATRCTADVVLWAWNHQSRSFEQKIPGTCRDWFLFSFFFRIHTSGLDSKLLSWAGLYMYTYMLLHFCGFCVEGTAEQLRLITRCFRAGRLDWKKITAGHARRNSSLRLVVMNTYSYSWPKKSQRAYSLRTSTFNFMEHRFKRSFKVINPLNASINVLLLEPIRWVWMCNNTWTLHEGQFSL